MTITEMSLPVDIPWKRMGVSEDMIDKQYGDLNFPEKWRSSIALFYHELTDLPPEYCNRKITYLKVASTITNYEPSDYTILDELRKYELYYGMKGPFKHTVEGTYPCYGALLQIGVFPNPSTGILLHDFPYIASFQPRKREMYETVSQSGEVLSQSDNKVNLSKNATTTDTTENYDVQGGGGSMSYGWGFVSATTPEKQEGTIGKSQYGTQDIKTTDTSRQNRESHSYSANINQLYSLLESYHLGSNRCIFFMQPRPHIQDLKFSFISGPRRLEGIQEFLLVVNRPANVPGICVEVALETAHFRNRRWYYPRLIPLHELYSPGNLSKTAAALGLDAKSYWPDFVYQTQSWNKHDAWTRSLVFEAETKKAGAIAPEITNAVTNGWMTWDEYAAMRQIVKKLPSIGIEDIALIFEEYIVDEAGTFFVVGRKLGSCMRSLAGPADTIGSVDLESSDTTHIFSNVTASESIVFEKDYVAGSDIKSDNTLKTSNNQSTGTDSPAVKSNSIISAINETLWSSLGSIDRYPYGKLSFMETDFMLEELSSFISLLQRNGIRGKTLDEIPELSSLAKMCVDKLSEIKDITDLGTLTTERIAHDLGITNLDAKKIRYELLIRSLKGIEIRKPLKKMKPINTIIERFKKEYPKEELRELENSARISTKKVVHLAKTRNRGDNSRSKNILSNENKMHQNKDKDR